MKIGKVTVCDHCGAAYTEHTNECPSFGKPAPMAAPVGEFDEEQKTNPGWQRDDVQWFRFTAE